MAETCGFCMGVQRAVRMVLDASQDPATALPIRTPGPLIHNEQVLEVLERQGVLEMGDDGQDNGGTAVVRAHGLAKARRQELGRRYERLLDATCPHVARVQNLVEQYAAEGYLCVVVGDRGHAEVDGVLSYAGEQGRVVAGPEEVDRLPDAQKVAVVAQTTQDQEVYERTVDALGRRYGECLVFDTICRATARRQEDVRKLAGQVDAMIVVGSRMSANTRRLAQISEAGGTPTFHVETEQDLDVERILQCRRVGLTAGASTPHWMIRRIILHLERENRRRNRPLLHRLRQAVAALVFTNLYAAGAVAALTYAMAHLLPDQPPALGLCMGVSFCFVLAQQLLNQYARRESLYLSEPARADFFMSHERLLLLTGAAAWGLALLLAAFLGTWVFLLVVVGSLGGLTYQLPFPPPVA
ncbi:MAG: 4-hydroxy-3-methylbut-2-enyl diphosphate reductase, partial [Candidatus Brocadiia bacterium]